MSTQPALDHNGNTTSEALSLTRTITGSAKLLAAMHGEKPIAHPKSKRRWTDRDYIFVGSPTSKQLPPNPFIERHRIAAAVIDSVADAYGLTAGLITGPARARDIVYPRSIICRLLRDWGMTYPVIGRRLGNRDHSTIIHSVEVTFPRAIRSDIAAKGIYENHRHMMAKATANAA